MENGGENVDRNCLQSVLLEHDYSDMIFHNNNQITINKVNMRLKSEKKFHTAFKTVDKWADSVTLRLPTGDDRKKIVDREITIHKVKYPFLPEQQIRGKVYEKFGIPTVMGGLLSRRKDQKKMAEPGKWHSMQKLAIKPDKLDEDLANSILDNLTNDSDVKSEVTAAETVDSVSLSCQPTQIASVSLEATKCLMENRTSSDSSETSISGSDSRGNLRATSLEDLPTQSYEHNWKKKLLDRDLNANLAASDFPRSEKRRGKKRKINVSPAATRPWENEEYCKRMKICGANEAESVWRKSSQREGDKSQGHDFVTLDHSYSSGQKNNAQKLAPFSEIAGKSGRISNENSARGKLTKMREDKENGENRFCQKDEGDVIILDEFTSLGEKIILSPIILSPAKKVENPGPVETLARKSAGMKNSTKCLRFYGNFTRMETASKLRDLTNFVGPKTPGTADESEAINCPENSSPRRASLPRFIHVDSFSNGCCEYDRDMKEISKFSTSANYFHNLELMSKNNLKIDKNAEEFEMREKVDEILKFLQNEPL